MFIGRKDYLELLSEWKDKKTIKVLTGLRRIGKSEILNEYEKKLLIGKQIQESQIIKYDFNDPLLSSVTYLDLYKQILEKANKNKINYLFLDEIQEVKEFEKCVTGLFEHKTIKFDIYLTGSNSHMFSEQLATLLGGRKIEIQILPLTYYELKNSDIENNIDNYLIYGGMGEIVEYYKQHKLAEMKIKQIFNDTIKNDIINRYNIRNKEEFTKIIEYSFKTIGKHLNPQNIFDFLHSNKQKVISKPSIIRMHNQICSSIVLNKVKYYNTKAKTSLNSKAKYYAGDLGMFSAIVGFNPNDSYRSVRIENLVFLQLKKLNYEVYTSIDYLNREIDFVAVKNNTKKYIQVCDELNENNYERESRSLLWIKDNYEKFILCNENNLKEEKEDGIKIINIKKWLLDLEKDFYHNFPKI